MRDVRRDVRRGVAAGRRVDALLASPESRRVAAITPDRV